MNRRDLLKSAAATSVGLLFVKPATAFGYQANSAVRIGLLGCGNRGTSVATSFAQNTSAVITALGDIFPDNLAVGQAHFNQLNRSLGKPTLDPSLLFHGPDAFQQLAHSSAIDSIQISTPPFFHVEHLAAAVDAGKHVYCEKPVGIDVAQAKQALEIAKRVKPTQSVDVGFQVRKAPPIAEVLHRVQTGALGKIASITANYNAPASKDRAKPGDTPNAARLRNWLWDRVLSGDILVEQNIHIIDLCNLVLGAHPLRAVATGGRNVLTHAGDCWDNYQVIYTYPNNVHVSFSSTQFGEGAFDAGLHIFGADGLADAPYAGPVRVTGPNAWAWADSTRQAAGSGHFAANGSFSDNLAEADRDKDRDFIDSIVTGKPHNQIADGVETALSCMLGRMAGYTGKDVTWDDLLAHGENWKLDVDLNKLG